MRTEKSGSTSKRRHGPAKIATLDVDLGDLAEPFTLSDVTAVSGRNDRLRVAINGVSIGDVTLDFVADQGVREGRTISRGEAGEVLAAVARTLVLDKALDLLAVRARSSRDLRTRLRRAGAPDGDISWTIDRLGAQGFVDDAAYARQVARAKVMAGGVSRRRVEKVLRQRGVAGDIAADAIEATLSEVELDEHGAALAAAEKRLKSLASLDPQVRRQRLYAFLARRGYETDIVRKVLKEVLD
jgi:regulatory protein